MKGPPNDKFGEPKESRTQGAHRDPRAAFFRFGAALIGTRVGGTIKVFIVNESNAGKKELSELFADLLCSEYFRRGFCGSETKRLNGERP